MFNVIVLSWWELLKTSVRIWYTNFNIESKYPIHTPTSHYISFGNKKPSYDKPYFNTWCSCMYSLKCLGKSAYYVPIFHVFLHLCIKSFLLHSSVSNYGLSMFMNCPCAFVRIFFLEGSRFWIISLIPINKAWKMWNGQEKKERKKYSYESNNE